MPPIVTEHAVFEAQRRGIDLELVLSALQNPQQRVSAKRNRTIFQNRYYDKIMSGEMLLRVIVEPEGADMKIISVYKTSKIDKYWIEGGTT